jgi:putative methyltransferase (TIGR04325 family)
MNKKLLYDFIPPIFIRFFSGLFYGWHGDYANWEDAKKKCTGYNSLLILNKVKSSAMMVKEGKAAYERDSHLFDKVQYSYPLLSGLMWIAAQNNGKINVLDFGGSLGSTYFQNKLFLDSLNDVNWCIVEQPDFVEVGLESIENKNLHFYYSIDDCLKAFKIDVILLSSVLQYLEYPYLLLEKVNNIKCDYVILDRTPFVKGKDRITVQKVNPKIYKGSYPCWFFNELKFIEFMSSHYSLITEFEALDKANIPSVFKGFLFRIIS